jgi:energy-coupling factor transporter ATP-binding protein EcfA2
MLQETAVVLAGPSGSGKSSLALAAAHAGLTVLSEDTVFVQLRPKLRLWSRMDAIHVLERDAPAGALGAMRFRSGRWKKILPMAMPQNFADEAVLCVLAAGADLSLTPMAPEDAIAALTANPEPGYEFYGARSVEAVRMLAVNGAWRLTLSKSPHEAIDLIRRTIVPDKPG